MAYRATLPDPDTTTRHPSSVLLRVASMCSVNITTPYPVASLRTVEPDRDSPLPVRTPDSKRFVIRLYWPNR